MYRPWAFKETIFSRVAPATGRASAQAGLGRGALGHTVFFRSSLRVRLCHRASMESRTVVSPKALKSDAER